MCIDVFQGASAIYWQCLKIFVSLVYKGAAVYKIAGCCITFPLFYEKLTPTILNAMKKYTPGKINVPSQVQFCFTMKL